MSRSLRSAVSLAQTAMQAGPSTQTFFRPTLSSHTYQSRRQFNFNNYVPDFFLKQRAENIAKNEAEAAKKEAKRAGQEPAEVAESAPHKTVEVTEGGLFDELVEEAQAKEAKKIALVRRHKPDEVQFGSAKKFISPKRANLLARQIQGLSIDEAILQMKFSDKKAAKWVKSNLVYARDSAIDQHGMDRDKLIVARSFVNQEKYGPRRLDIKGRGKHGVMRKPYARIKYVLKEGKSYDERKELEFTKKLNKAARSAGQVREDGKLGRKMVHAWHW